MIMSGMRRGICLVEMKKGRGRGGREGGRDQGRGLDRMKVGGGEGKGE